MNLITYLVIIITITGTSRNADAPPAAFVRMPRSD